MEIKEENIRLMNTFGEVNMSCPFYGSVSQLNVWDKIIDFEKEENKNGNIVSWEDARLVTNFQIKDVPDYFLSSEPVYKIGR